MFTRKNKPATLSIFRPDRDVPKKKEPKRDYWVEYWNSLPGLRSHRIGFHTYESGASAIQELFRGLSPRVWNKKWLARHKINSKLLTRPWSHIEVRRAIKILSEMTQAGNWPGPGTWLSSLSLSDAVYNSMSQISMMTYARSLRCAREIREVHLSFVEEKASPDAKKMLVVFRDYHVEISSKIAEELARQYNVLCESDPLISQIAGGPGGFARMLSEWLLEKNTPEPGDKITPPDGWLWRQFARTL